MSRATLARARGLFYNTDMNLKCLIFYVGATLCLTGCFSIETATVKPSQAEHVVINNWGWKLFDWIPLCSGNVSEGAFCETAFFRDDVTFEKLQARFEKYANGREIECPVWTPIDYQIFTIYGIPIPYIFTYKEYTLSGTLK